MPGKDCAPGRRPPGAARRAMAMSFHIIRQREGLAKTLSRVAEGVTSRRKKLEARFRRAGQPGPDDAHVSELALARRTETQAQWLTRDLRTLTQWLSRDVLTLGGPDPATRQELFDFIADELERLEPKDARASARCASRCGANATICSPSPARSTRSRPASRGPSKYRRPSCARPACCATCPLPHGVLTGVEPTPGGDGRQVGQYSLSQPPSSTPSSTW